MLAVRVEERLAADRALDEGRTRVDEVERQGRDEDNDTWTARGRPPRSRSRSSHRRGSYRRHRGTAAPSVRSTAGSRGLIRQQRPRGSESVGTPRWLRRQRSDPPDGHLRLVMPLIPSMKLTTFDENGRDRRHRRTIHQPPPTAPSDRRARSDLRRQSHSAGRLRTSSAKPTSRARRRRTASPSARAVAHHEPGDGDRRCPRGTPTHRRAAQGSSATTVIRDVENPRRRMTPRHAGATAGECHDGTTRRLGQRHEHSIRSGGRGSDVRHSQAEHRRAGLLVRRRMQRARSRRQPMRAPSRC